MQFDSYFPTSQRFYSLISSAMLFINGYLQTKFLMYLMNKKLIFCNLKIYKKDIANQKSCTFLAGNI